MSDHDELLFGTGREVVRDTDGDGVDDVQERQDGTDPNDATDSIRHDTPTRNASLDPHGDLAQVTLERETIIDVTTNLPEGKSLEQSLPADLDGKAIPTGPNRYGNADADKLLTGHNGDANSPFDIQRDPMVAADNTPSDGGPPDGDIKHAPPPGVEAAGSPNHNMDLVSGKSETPLSDFVYKATIEMTNIAVDVGSIPGAIYDGIKEGLKPAKVDSNPPPGPPPPPPPPDASQDPDAVGGGTPTDAEVARAMAVHDGATDVVRGQGAPQIDIDAPPGRPIDLVTDPGDGDADVVDSSTTVAPPGQQISHPVNPQDGLPGGLDPSAGGGAGGDGGDPGLMSASSGATAATADVATQPNGITNVGDGSIGGGIHAVASVVAEDVTDVDVGTPLGAATDVQRGLDVGERPDIATTSDGGMGSAAPAEGSGRPWQGSTVAQGDDDGLDELEVERYVAPDADTADGGSDSATDVQLPGVAIDGGTQVVGVVDVTGMGSAAPTEGSGRPWQGSTVAQGDDDDLDELEVERYVAPDADTADGGSDSPLDVQLPGAAIDGIIIPETDQPFGDGVASLPLDPVADAMTDHIEVLQHDVPQDGFSVLEVDHGLAVPDEVDLDDGF